jgi:hypothetical protein
LDRIDGYIQSIAFKFGNARALFVLNSFGDFIRIIMLKLDWFVAENMGSKGENMYEKCVENWIDKLCR